MNGYLYFDGGSRFDKCIYSYIIYEDDSKKNKICQKSGRCGNGDSNIAEARSMLLGIRKAAELGIDTIKIYGDCQVFIKQILGQSKIKSVLLADIKTNIIKILDKFKSYDIIWIRRHKNKDADKLIKITINRCWPKRGKNGKKNKKYKQ